MTASRATILRKTTAGISGDAERPSPERFLKGAGDATMTQVFRTAADEDLTESAAIAQAARVLMAGGLALIPTETVYGLAVAVSAFTHSSADATEPLVNGCPVPAEETGYRRIFDLKQRELAQTVPWLVDGADALERYGHDVDPGAQALARAFWPGALTLIVPARDDVPAFMRAADGTVALRSSASPVVAALIEACGSPLACTSANTHGAPAPASFSAVEQRILDGVDIAIDAGATPCQDASTIVSFPGGEPQIIRQGALSAADIKRVLEELCGPERATSLRKG